MREIQLSFVVDGASVISQSAVNIPLEVTARVAGPPGSAAGSFTQPFTNQSSVTVNHNLGKRPSVAVIDSASDEVTCDVHHIDLNSLQIVFSASFTGNVIYN
jgi:hypothetical protein